MAGAKTAPKGGPSVRAVDPSEYEPQVVELPAETASGQENDGKGTDRGRTGTPEETGSDGGSPGGEELSDGERLALWIKNLKAMRQRYLASLTEQEKEKLFKSLEI